MMEAKEQVEAIEEGPAYPWGTKIELNNEAMDLLGLDADDFLIGDRLKIEAKVKVCEVSKRAFQEYGTEKEKYNQNVEMQITHIEIMPADSKSMRDLMRMIKG